MIHLDQRSGFVQRVEERLIAVISTVTTTTISIVTTLSLAGSLAIVAILTLLALLIHKELTTASHKRTARILSRVLNIGIVPLLAVFTFIVVVKVVAALQ
ncbi:MAG: hypothetical protein JW934_03600 [Anaerolineae bacterium]|nr:hypothetical protein [Anaerolineae bacterium]